MHSILKARLLRVTVAVTLFIFQFTTLAQAQSASSHQYLSAESQIEEITPAIVLAGDGLLELKKLLTETGFFGAPPEVIAELVLANNAQMPTLAGLFSNNTLTVTTSDPKNIKLALAGHAEPITLTPLPQAITPASGRFNLIQNPELKQPSIFSTIAEFIKGIVDRLAEKDVDGDGVGDGVNYPIQNIMYVSKSGGNLDRYTRALERVEGEQRQV